MTGLEVPAILLAKFLGGKAITWAGGHLLATTSGATLTHMSMIAGHNVIGAAAASATIFGAGTALYHGYSAYTGLLESIEKRKSRDIEAKLSAGALGKIPGPLGGHLITGAYWQVEQVYKALNIKDEYGEPKTRLDQIRKCDQKSCDCTDFRATGDKPTFDDFLSKRRDLQYYCQCGHAAKLHGKAGNDEIDLHLVLLIYYAAEVYPDLHRQDKEGKDKTDITAIAGCVNCGCTDFRKNHQGSGCYCGPNHKHVEDAPPRGKLEEALIEILAEYKYRQLENTTSNGKLRLRFKKFLYEINHCPKSGCWDFKWKTAFGSTEFCRCGSRYTSHHKFSPSWKDES